MSLPRGRIGVSGKGLGTDAGSSFASEYGAAVWADQRWRNKTLDRPSTDQDVPPRSQR
jgi:hypothetical protein